MNDIEKVIILMIAIISIIYFILGVWKFYIKKKLSSIQVLNLEFAEFAAIIGTLVCYDEFGIGVILIITALAILWISMINLLELNYNE